jgi:hypothetical protein
MKFTLRSLIAASGVISLVGITALWLPFVFVFQLVTGATLVSLIMNMAAAFVIAGILLWMAKMAWNDSQLWVQIKSPTIRNPRIEPPSWGKPPPLPNSSPPAPIPPKP